MEVEGNSFEDLEKKLIDKDQVPKKIKIINEFPKYIF